MRHYQLTFNKDVINGMPGMADCDKYVPYVLEELHDRPVCPTAEMESILEYIYEQLDESFSCGYVAINLEKGGRKNHVHITAYVQIKYQPRTMKAWQKMFEEHPHIEDCRGDSNANIDYIYKRGTEENEKKKSTLRWGPFEMGEPVFIPAKVNPKSTAEKIKGGMSYYDMAMENPDFLLQNPYGVAEAIRSRDLNGRTTARRQKFHFEEIK